MAQDFYDPLQPFDYIVQKLKDAQPSLGLEYVAENDEELLPAYPAILVQVGRTEREHHATGLFLVTINIILWVFHADMTVGPAIRSRQDIQLATDIRKLLHADKTLGGHIIFGFVNDEFPGPTGRVGPEGTTNVVTTRMSWSGNNRVPFEAS